MQQRQQAQQVPMQQQIQQVQQAQQVPMQQQVQQAQQVPMQQQMQQGQLQVSENTPYTLYYFLQSKLSTL